MAEQKPKTNPNDVKEIFQPKNRRVARPRLLKALLDEMVEHDLGLDSLIGSLVDARSKPTSSKTQWETCPA